MLYQLGYRGSSAGQAQSLKVSQERRCLSPATQGSSNSALMSGPGHSHACCESPAVAQHSSSMTQGVKVCKSIQACAEEYKNAATANERECGAQCPPHQRRLEAVAKSCDLGPALIWSVRMIGIPAESSRAHEGDSAIWQNELLKLHISGRDHCHTCMLH